MKRILTLALAALMLLPALAACAGDGTNEPVTTTAAPIAADTTTAAPETEYDPLPADMKFDGQTLRLFSRGRAWNAGEMTVNGMTGEVVNDAIFERQQKIETRLGIKIENTLSADGGTNYDVIADQLRKLVTAQSDEYDLVADGIYTTMPVVVEGLHRNLNDIPTLNLENEWWPQYFNAELTFGGKQYIATGDATLSLKRFTFVTVFNKELFREYGIGDEIYDTVRTGKWTLDAQTEIATKIYRDLNGNNQPDMEDLFGYAAAERYISADPYWSSLDLPIFDKTAEDEYVYALNVERLSAACEKINRLWWDEASIVFPKGSAESEQDDMAIKFATGTLSMMNIRLLNLEHESIRNMEDDYGIIPIPKLDENQAEYFSFAHDQFSVLTVPTTVPEERLEMVGASMEYLGFVSRQLVTPAYYEIALKNKYFSDEASGEMLDLIFDNVVIDAGVVYSGSLGDSASVHMTLREIVATNSASVAARFKVLDKLVPKSLDRVQQKLRDIGK